MDILWEAIADSLIYSFLLFAFHWLLMKKPKVSFFLGFIILAKVGHSISLNSNIAAQIFNFVTFLCLLICLFLSRKSPNFLWLFSGMVFIKLIDVSLHPWLRNQGAYYYLVVSIYDLAVLFLIMYRTLLVGMIASMRLGEFSRWGKAAIKYQKLSVQENILMAIYCMFVIINLISLGEKMVRDFTDFYPTIIHSLYPYAKLTLNLLELVLLMHIVSGHAIDYKQRKRVF